MIHLHKYYRDQQTAKLRRIEREVEEVLRERRQLESQMKAAAGMARLKTQQ